MQTASLEAFLYLEGVPAKIPLDASHYEWHQHVDHHGRPRSKVRAGLWSFATSQLDRASYEHLLDLMLQPYAVVEAHARYGRADGQGTFVTVWGRQCRVCHVYSHFDARGTQGHAPSWTLYFSLAPQEMGRESGTAGSFVMPAARSYAYAGVPVSVAGPVQEKALIARPFLKNEADPIHDLFGPGRLSHTEEWQLTLEQLRKEGVEIIHRKGAMAYGPSPSSGKPGQLLLDEDASIGALRHEAQHYADDKQLGFPGAIRYYQEPMLRWQTEYNAYMKEVSITRHVRRFDIGRLLVNNARNERTYLMENFGLKL